MLLATASARGRPSVHTMLLKGVDKRGFVFLTNQGSRKERELKENPYASLCFFWQPLMGQVRIDGSVEAVSENEPDIIGLAVGTRPDCVPDPVLDLLVDYHEQGFEIRLELGLQSAFDESLKRGNRGHDFAEYKSAVQRARKRGLQVCTHLIIGLPDEDRSHQEIMPVGP